jgi:hypothetical protein
MWLSWLQEVELSMKLVFNQSTETIISNQELGISPGGGGGGSISADGGSAFILIGEGFGGTKPTI